MQEFIGAWDLERTEKVGPSPLVAGTRLPSQNSIANGRSGKVLSISWRSFFVRASGISHEPTALASGTVLSGLELCDHREAGTSFEDGGTSDDSYTTQGWSERPPPAG